MDLLNKTEQFVADAFRGNENDISHHKRTTYWIKKLKPDAEEALLIAGMSHDIERAFHGDWKAGSSDPDQLKKHQELSASDVASFLKQENAPQELIERVENLILHHEEGGTDDQNILCDADCLAYFEEKAIRNAKKAKQEDEVEKYKKKLEYIWSRIHTQRAKEIGKMYYQNALIELSS